ncbi:MAG: c-type cytochrome [Candidatus Rariloculaceae bacterium]
MPEFRSLPFVVVALLVAGRLAAQTPDLGMPIEPEDIDEWDIAILPDGSGLPPGSGTAAEGAPIFAAKCALCHGVNLEGGISLALVGGEPLTDGIDTVKTISNFWPVATTLFDYTRRAMPWLTPRTLTDDEVYALTAYLLAENHIINEDEEMNAESLPRVEMPNRDGFIVRFPDLIP